MMQSLTSNNGFKFHIYHSEEDEHSDIKIEDKCSVNRYGPNKLAPNQLKLSFTTLDECSQSYPYL